MGQPPALPVFFDGMIERQTGAEAKPLAPRLPRWDAVWGRLGPDEASQSHALGRTGVAAHRTGAGGSVGREDLRRQIRSQLRRIFLLVDEFFLLGKFGSGRRRLDSLMQDVIGHARDCFFFAAALHSDIGVVSPEHEQCVMDLEDFVRVLRSDAGPGVLETLHAMDSLIVQCVLLDAEQSDVALHGLAVPGNHIV